MCCVECRGGGGGGGGGVNISRYLDRLYSVQRLPLPPPLSDQLQLVTGQMSLQLALSASPTTTAIVSLTSG